MKKLLILAIMIYLLPAKADILLDIMNGKYTETSNISYDEEDEHCENEYSDSSGEPEHYSWDNLYLCNYCGIEVIVNPYAEESDY